MALSVDNVKKLVSSIGDMGTIVGAGVELRRLPFEKVLLLMDLFQNLISLKYAELLPELKDLSDDEKTELDKVFRAHFDIKADMVEAGIEEGFGLLLMAMKAIADLMGRAKPKA